MPGFRESMLVASFGNDDNLISTFKHIVRITSEEKGKGKELMPDLTVQAMLIHLVQTQVLMLFEHKSHEVPDGNPLAAVVQFMEANLGV